MSQSSTTTITVPAGWDQREVIIAAAEPSATPSPTPPSKNGPRFYRRPGGKSPLSDRNPPTSSPAVAASIPDHPPLIQVLLGQEMELVDQRELTPADPSTGKSSAPPAAALLDVAIHSGESAAVLVERGGVYQWVFKSADRPQVGTRPAPETAETSTSIRFEIPLNPSPLEPSPPSGKDDGNLLPIRSKDDEVLGVVRTYVFKFAVPLPVGKAITHFERNIRCGWIHLEKPDPQDWKPLKNLRDVKWKKDRSARILLLIHGTFSSTLGEFSALGSTPWGQAFLKGALANYDLVLGFDHPTLSVDPLENAAVLLEHLKELPENPHIDVICHSRGGLVFRSLTENLLPVDGWKAQWGRTIFVAATNGGTPLAETANWERWLNVYTNLSTAACAALSLFPQAPPVDALLKEANQGTGALVKTLASQILDENAVPGLTAMRPYGPFIRQINQVQTGQPTPAKSHYYAVTSAFRAVNWSDHYSGLPSKLRVALAVFLAGASMAADHDLVVNQSSVSDIDSQSGVFIKDSLDFREALWVHHLGYFVQPEVIKALSHWLRLMDSANAEALDHPLAIGSVVAPELPLRFSTDFVNLPSQTLGHEALDHIGSSEAVYFVMSHLSKNGLQHYFLPKWEFLYRFDRHDYRYRYDASLGDIASSVFRIDLPEAIETGAETRGNFLEPSDSRAETLHHSDSPDSIPPDVLIRNNKITAIAREIYPSAFSNLVQNAKHILDNPSEHRAWYKQRMFPKFRASPETVTRLKPLSATEIRRGKDSKGKRVAAEILCRVRAEMDDPVIVGKTTPVEVTLSQEDLQRAISATAQEQQIKVDARQSLRIQLIPRKNLVLADTDKNAHFKESMPPDPESPVVCTFNVKATAPGEGELFVEVSQFNIPLLTLALRPTLLAAQNKPLTPSRESATALAVAISPPDPAKPMHQLRIFEMEDRDQTYYTFELFCDGLGIFDQFESKRLTGDQKSYIQKRYEEIQEFWAADAQEGRDFDYKLRVFGDQLLMKLFPENLQKVLWDVRDKIGSILVISTEPFIPWELVHLKEPGTPLKPGEESCFLAQMGLVRWLYGSWPPDKLTVREDRAFYVIPDYPDPDLVLGGVQSEKGLLKSLFHAEEKEASKHIVLEMLSEPGAFDLLHFGCHGEAQTNDIAAAGILLNGRVLANQYKPEFLTSTEVESTANLRNEDGNRPIVMINACQTGRAGYNLTGLGGFAQAFVGGGAGVFVSCLWSVDDETASIFARTFYNGLSGQKTLSEAAIAARAAARKSGDPTWLAYVVYGHPHAQLELG